MTEAKMQLVDWLDDLCVRFIINLPQEELESVERICFQVEEAQWFYEDFVRPLDPDLPSLNLRNFCLRIFQHCPLLSQFSSYHHSTAFSEFLAYKTRVPVRGAIMLNHDMDAVVLVKGWKKGANWSFPRGKINKDEPDLDCAIREVYEETGFDVRQAGLVAKDDDVKFIEVTMREQHMRLYVFRDVPMDTLFEPKTRKEISKIQWYKLSELPTVKKGKNQQEEKGNDLAMNANKFYMVAPFLSPLRKWIQNQRKLDKHRVAEQPETVAPAVQQAQGNLGVADPNGSKQQGAVNDMERLVAGLRQSGQTSRISDLPELSIASPFVTDENAHPGAPMQPLSDEPSGTSKSHHLEALKQSMIDQQKSNALLALLKGSKAPNIPPQTPAEQVIKSPQMPPSPKHHQTHPERRHAEPSNASPALHPIQNATLSLQPKITGEAAATLQQPNLQPPKTALQNHTHGAYAMGLSRPMQPYLSQSLSNQSLHLPRTVPAPYQRTSDPSFTQASKPAEMLSSIPPANKLPPPKLTSHSSALLSLFKSGAPKSSQAPPAESAPLRSIAAPIGRTAAQTEQAESARSKAGVTSRGPQPEPVDIVSEMSGADSTNEPHTHYSVPRPISNPHGAKQAHAPSLEPKVPMANNRMVPAEMAALHATAQTTQATPTSSGKPQSEHQDALLKLFRQSSKALPDVNAPVSAPAKSSLEPPPTSFELSALPSPSYPREPSRAHNVSHTEQVRPQFHDIPQQRTQPLPAPRKPTVSATVDGPLNVPQFESLLQKSTKNTGSTENGFAKTPIKILSRPARSEASPASASPNRASVLDDFTPAPPDTMVSTPTLNDKSGILAPPNTMVSTPAQPNTTDQYQPNILRGPQPPIPRPSHNDTILSPIEPLPSPKHAIPLNRRANQTQEQRQSLLSLFSNPAPSPVETPTRVNSALVSPPAIGAHKDNGPGSSKMDRNGSLASSISGGEGSRHAEMNIGRKTPRTTANDRSFLLGYLDSVARGEQR